MSMSGSLSAYPLYRLRLRAVFELARERPGDGRCSWMARSKGVQIESWKWSESSTYVTSLGFVEQAIAQRSMKAAKEALGRRQ